MGLKKNTRARREEDKAKRRQSILRAAEARLNLSNPVLPSAESVAEKAGLAKGTLYLYFRTKEEIYLTLLSEGLRTWLEVVKETLEEPLPNLDHFLRAYVHFALEHPKVLFLAQLSPAILERNISVQNAYAFKKMLVDEVQDIATLLTRAFPGLEREKAIRSFILSYVVTLGLWQHANPPPLIARILRRKSLSILQLNFEQELEVALKNIWKGTMS